MPAMILEDRVLARVAFQAVGRSEPSDANHGAELAINHALKALRVLGAVITPWTVRAVQDDVACIFADAARMTQARALATQVSLDPQPGVTTATPAREAA